MKTSATWMAIATLTALLSGCVVAPTPYQSVAEGQPSGFGYTSVKVDDALYRVSFRGNGRTARRAIDAYALYRSAEIAKEANAPAFMVLEGKGNRAVLDGDDKFARVDGRPLDFDEFSVARLSDGAGPADRVVGIEPLPVTRTAGLSPVFVPRSMPMPSAPVPRTTYTPMYIYTASGPVVFPQESLLIRMLSAVPAEEDPRLFVTEDVLTRIGPRIVRKPG
jgi:hypothetical protein